MFAIDLIITLIKMMSSSIREVENEIELGLI